jgi:hypothetical protein
VNINIASVRTRAASASDAGQDTSQRSTLPNFLVDCRLTTFSRLVVAADRESRESETAKLAARKRDLHSILYVV